MNRKARLNYIHALSSQVEKKKMYKAKKQWVVAGISFLVATGMGAIGSHLTTHADTAQANSQTTLPINKGSQSSASVEPQAKAMHNALVRSNVKPQVSGSNTQIPSVKAGTTPVSSKVSGSQPSSLSTKSSNTSNVVTSGSSVSSQGVKLFSNSSIQSNSVKKPMMLFGEIYHNIQSPQVPTYATGKWGTATWVFNDGNLTVANGTLSKPLPSEFFKQEPGKHINAGQSDVNNVFGTYVKNITVSNAIAPRNMSDMFAGSKGNGPFDNVQTIDLSGLDTSNVHEMNNLFHGDQYLTNIKFGKFDTSDVSDMSAMFDDDASIQSLDLSSFDTRNVNNYNQMFWDTPSLVNLDLSNFQLKSSANTTGMFDITSNNKWSVHRPNQLKELILSPSFRNQKNNDSSNFFEGFNISNKMIGNDPNLVKQSTGKTSSDWASVASDPGDWINTNYEKTYNIILHDELSGSDATLPNIVGLQDAPYIHVSPNQLASAGNYRLAPNASYDARKSSDGKYTLDVLNMSNVAHSGNWGSATWAILRENGELLLQDGSLETKNVPSQLSKLANMVYSIDAKDVDAPAIASDMLQDFTNANSIDLTGMNFEHTNDVKNILPANTNADVKYPDSFDTALDNQETDDDSAESADINSINSLTNNNTQLSKEVSSANSETNNANSLDSAIINVLSNGSYKNTGLNTNDTNLLNSVIAKYNNWNSGSTQATSNSSWIHNNSNSVSSASASAQNADSWVNSYGSNASKAGSWYISNASSLSSTANVYSYVSAAESSLGTIEAISNEITGFENDVGSAGSLQTQINDLSNDIGAVSGGSNLATEINTLSGDYTTLDQLLNGTASSSGIKSQIVNLQGKAAITFTFTGSNSNAIPVTMTNGYIESNAQSHNGNTYDITNLLDEDVASGGKHVVGNYTVTLNNDNNGNGGSITYHAPTNSQPQHKGKGQKGFAMLPPHKFMLDSSKSSVPTSIDTAHNVILANNQAEYTGTITLNFGSTKHQVKLNFDTKATNPNVLASDKVNLLNYAHNAQNPSDFAKDNLINGFDTTGFKFTRASDNPYSFTIQPSDATNQNGADVHNNYNITLNYSAQPVTENIQYVYGSHVENQPNTTTTAKGNDESQGDWKDTNNLKSGWKLANSDNNPFTFTNNGIAKVNVSPVQTTDTINYVDQKGNQVGSQTFTGNNYQATDAGNNNIDVTKANDTSLDKNYKLASTDNTFEYDGGTHQVNVTGNARSPKNTIPSSTKPSDANNPKSNQSMTKPTSDSDVLFTINIRDYNADGTKEINHYTKYATESGEVGDPFTIKASDYLTNGFTINTKKSADKTVDGTISDNQLQPNSITFDYYAKPYDPNAYKTNPNDPTLPKPITVQYIGEFDGKADQVVKTYPNAITGNTGDTGNLTDIESKASVPTGYTVNGTNYSYTITTDPQTIKVNLNSETAKQINNGGKNYKPTTPSDNPSPKVPSDNTVKKDASHGFATVIINENIDGKLAHQSAQTVDESNKNVGSDYTIEPTNFTPNGYQVDSNDKDLTGTINPDGSLSSDSATFTYDVNSSEIASITVTYYNQYGDLISLSDGKSSMTGEDVTSKQATQTISASDLATKGTVGDYIDITEFLTAPKGHHFNKNIIDSSSNNLDHVQLQKANNGKPVHLGLAVFENEPKSNSNSAKPSSSAAQVSMSSDQLASLAKDIGSNITIRPNVSETDEVVDNSALTSLANEVATNNQEISNLANKPASNTTSTIDYDYFNNLVNSGVSQLTDVVNKDFKADIHNTAKDHATNITRGFKLIKKHIRWIMITKPVKLYNKHGVAKTLRPSKVTLDVHSVYKSHGHFVFKVSYHHHTFFMAGNHSTFKNAYLAQGKFAGRRVRVTKPVYEFRHKDHDIVKLLHKGSALRIKRIVQIGNFNMTRIQLSNGNWISANKNYIKIL